jgi:hypothetical protein
MNSAGVGMPKPDNMSDLLSAASLLLTVLGIVYGTWYAEIVAAIAMDYPDPVADRGLVRGKVRAALYGKALPLALAASILTAVFLPDAWAIGHKGINSFCALGRNALHDYDAVDAAFCLVVFFAAALSVYLLFLVSRLVAKLWKMRR